MEFTIERRGNDVWAWPETGEEFFVGRRVRFEGRMGLCNVLPGLPPLAFAYRAANYEADVGPWAQIIAPTALSEGGSFLALNSYDRAGFTFGVGQFAAHVPDGDFVCLLRALLRRPEARDYFPDVGLKAGRVHRLGTPPLALECRASTQPLMAWLNPSCADIDGVEADVAARLIHWTRTHRPARLAQIAQMVDGFKASLTRVAARLPLDGRSAAECCVLADLLHHGRAGRRFWTLAATALRASDPLDALLAIGSGPWAARRKTLGQAIAANASLSRWRWNTARCDIDQ